MECPVCGKTHGGLMYEKWDSENPIHIKSNSFLVCDVCGFDDPFLDGENYIVIENQEGIAIGYEYKPFSEEKTDMSMEMFDNFFKVENGGSI